MKPLAVNDDAQTWDVNTARDLAEAVSHRIARDHATAFGAQVQALAAETAKACALPADPEGDL
jgi:hypothetical protein